MNDEELHALAEQVGQRLSALEMRVAFAESCTGGWITKILTDIPGSSASLERGWVVYSNAAKAALGVSLATLERYGAVSEETVTELACLAVERSDADFGVAVSGIAGPDGGTADKPVGLVWFAWARRDGAAVAAERRFHGDRDAIRRQAVAAALQGLLEQLDR
jgi:nicotinamide-nucleotide amidase